MSRQVALQNPRNRLFNRQPELLAISGGPRYNEKIYEYIAPRDHWQTVEQEGLSLQGREQTQYTTHQGTTAITILALLKPEPRNHDLKRFGLRESSQDHQQATCAYSGADKRNYMRQATNSEVEVHDWLATMEEKALEFVRLRDAPVGVRENRAERQACEQASTDVYASLEADHDAFATLLNDKCDSVKNSLRPIHSYDGGPKGLRDGFQNRKQAHFKGSKNDVVDIMRLADEWTTIPNHFQPMKLYSFMSVSEQDAFWTRRYNGHKWKWDDG